jgi:hypothetical protein
MGHLFSLMLVIKKNSTIVGYKKYLQNPLQEYFKKHLILTH